MNLNKYRKRQPGDEDYFEYQGKGRWVLESWFDNPSVVMRNEHTGERMRFGMGGYTDVDFNRVSGLVKA